MVDVRNEESGADSGQLLAALKDKRMASLGWAGRGWRENRTFHNQNRNSSNPGLKYVSAGLLVEVLLALRGLSILLAQT